MTEKEIIAKQAENGNTLFYLQKSGLFFRAFDGGAFVLARVSGYSVVRHRRKEGDVLIAGFPEASLPKVMEQFAANGIELTPQSDTGALFLFRGGDPTPDESMVTVAKEKVAEADSTDYIYLKDLRKDLLAINVADCTPQEAMAHLRNLQIKCLAHMTI